MKYSRTYLIVLSILISILSGCSKGGSTAPVVVPDTTKPTIVISSPTAGQTFTAGGTIPIQVAFSDNEALKSYDITISKNLTSGVILKVVPISVPFTYSSGTTTLSGKSQSATLNISIPANTPTQIVTPGTYDLKVNCIDSSTNSASVTLIITIN